jgi:enoyl-CoA hydratase/carnithine racemase
VTEYECLRYEVDDGVATITLARPEKHNSFSPRQIREIKDAWNRVRFADDVGCALITGEGDRAFTSGYDLESEVAPQPGGPFMLDLPIAEIGPKSNDVWKPVIAAVNGMACGGAFYILGEVEFIIAADHATFFDPHVSHGMPAIYEPMFMLQRMPLGEIMRVSLLGRNERMTAQRAHEIGLVQEVVPLAELLETARWAAEAILSAPDQTAVQATMKAIWMAQQMSIQHALQSATMLLDTVGTETLAETGDRLRRRAIEPRLR